MSGLIGSWDLLIKNKFVLFAYFLCATIKRGWANITIPKQILSSFQKQNNYFFIFYFFFHFAQHFILKFWNGEGITHFTLLKNYS